jgi:RNA polymerase sigma factor (sigma-70 family)
MDVTAAEDPVTAAPNLASLLASLPEEERAVLVLHYARGKSAEEIAALLGVPIRAIQSVLASGRARLTSAIGIEAASE